MRIENDGDPGKYDANDVQLCGSNVQYVIIDNSYAQIYFVIDVGHFYLDENNGDQTGELNF